MSGETGNNREHEVLDLRYTCRTYLGRRTVLFIIVDIIMSQWTRDYYWNLFLDKNWWSVSLTCEWSAFLKAGSLARLTLFFDENSKQLVTINMHLCTISIACFRVSSAPSLFPHILENILQGLLGMLVYIDDILVTEKTRVDHNAKLEAMLTRLEEAGIRLKCEKFCFAMPSVKFF